MELGARAGGSGLVLVAAAAHNYYLYQAGQGWLAAAGRTAGHHFLGDTSDNTLTSAQTQAQHRQWPHTVQVPGVAAHNMAHRA